MGFPMENEFQSWPDLSKQAQEVIFTRKVEKVAHPPIFFNKNSLQEVLS